MNYIGSGKFGSYLTAAGGAPGRKGINVIGRRLHRLRIADWLAIKGSQNVFLDTTDIASCRDLSSTSKFRWTFNPYRLEKEVTYWLIRLISQSVLRVHITAISDSNAWKKLCVSENGITIKALTYEQWSTLIQTVVKRRTQPRYRSEELLALAKELNIGPQSLRVACCESSKIIASIAAVEPA